MIDEVERAVIERCHRFFGQHHDGVTVRGLGEAGFGIGFGRLADQHGRRFGGCCRRRRGALFGGCGRQCDRQVGFVQTIFRQILRGTRDIFLRCQIRQLVRQRLDQVGFDFRIEGAGQLPGFAFFAKCVGGGALFDLDLADIFWRLLWDELKRPIRQRILAESVKDILPNGEDRRR